MVNINKNLLPKKDLNKLFLQLEVTIGKQNVPNTKVLINELLGYEERLTLAKRLAALVLLLEGYSQYKTAKLLKLSPTTTEKISTDMAAGRYNGTIKIIGGNKKNYFAILETLDSILHLGGVLPHYNGIDRYRF